MMVLQMEIFVRLTVIFNNISCVNISYVVKNMAVRFQCEHKSDLNYESQIMSHTNVDRGNENLNSKIKNICILLYFVVSSITILL